MPQTDLVQPPLEAADNLFGSMTERTARPAGSRQPISVMRERTPPLTADERDGFVLAVSPARASAIRIKANLYRKPLDSEQAEARHDARPAQAVASPPPQSSFIHEI